MNKHKELLRKLMHELHLNSMSDAAKQAIAYWMAFDPDFIEFCEDYIQKLEQNR